MKLFFFIFIFLTALPARAESVPANARVSGSTWYCNEGFKKQNNQCLKFTVPQNARVSGSTWYCNDGFKKQGNSCTELSTEEYATLLEERAKTKASMTDGTVAYVSTVNSDGGSILKLENGAIVEINSYVGYLGYRKKAILYGRGSICNLWIEGKKSFSCSLLKAPQGNGELAKLVNIFQVKENGSILMMLDGTIFEVNSIDHIYTSLWLGISDAILINGNELFNFDEGHSVTVFRLK